MEIRTIRRIGADLLMARDEQDKKYIIDENMRIASIELKEYLYAQLDEAGFVSIEYAQNELCPEPHILGEVFLPTIHRVEMLPPRIEPHKTTIEDLVKSFGKLIVLPFRILGL